MKRLLLVTLTVFFTAFLIFKTGESMAIEEAKYEVVKTDGIYEIRDYAPHILAETVIDESLEKAGSKAFQPLFGYISGDNQASKKIAMTAPVSQQTTGEKIQMTAPVGQQRGEKGWVISFMMPDSYTLQSLPQPNNLKVTLRQVPPQKMAVVRYSGFWSEKNYLEHKLKLESWIAKMGLTTTGEATWARYNSPFTPWFLRRNEILIPIDAGQINITR
jgi:hypothetical protein